MGQAKKGADRQQLFTANDCAHVIGVQPGQIKITHWNLDGRLSKRWVIDKYLFCLHARDYYSMTRRIGPVRQFACVYEDNHW